MINTQLKTPELNDPYVLKLLEYLKAEFDPEFVKVHLVNNYKELNCFKNVELYVKECGGRIHYGWLIVKTDIVYEAIRHAVWEDENENLIDITPSQYPTKEILFVSDNAFEYKDQLTDNIRINHTKNKVVDDFIFLLKSIELLYSKGHRISDDQIVTVPELKKKIEEFENLKLLYQSFLSNGDNINSKCICGSEKRYKNCHGKIVIDEIKKDIRTFANTL